MKKSSIVLGLMLLTALPILANPVDVKTAKKAAETFLQSKIGSKVELQLVDYANKAEFSNFYVFGTNNSFVILSGDDCVQPILGYSTENPFGSERMPENVVWWLKGYDEQIAQAIKNEQKATTEIANEWENLLNGQGLTSKTSTAVAPLIQTKWGQGTPFNNLCPLDANSETGHAVTGCVATSMAQIIYYHYHNNALTNGIGSHSYNHPTYGTLSADFSATPYDWGNMKTNYYSGYNSTQANAVATLMFHCGVAVNMSYGPSASSSFSSDIPSALINYFNFSVTTEHKRRYPSDSTSFWIADLKKELDEGRPMEYNGTGSGGHSFICDGYDENNYFHFNWGWNGLSYDGYYPLDDLTPGSYNYNNDQGAVIGIKPASCETSAPQNFSASLDEGTRNANLTWEVVSSADGYNVFRNGMLIESLLASQTNYTDTQIPYGTNIYYIRSVDSNGEMSLPSEYKTITVSFPVPSGLSANLSNGMVYLSWNPSQNSISYNIYRNNVLIATNITSTTFNDNRPIPGTPTYYVKGVDAWGDESDASNAVSLNVPYQIPIAKNLCLSLSKDSSSLSWLAPDWCYPQTSSGQLSYGEGKTDYLWGAVYFAHRHLATDLASYTNKSIYKISTRVAYLGTYTVYIYTNSINDQPDPNALRDTRILNCTSGDWVDIDLSEPIPISGDKDIWIVIKQENTNSNYPVPSFNLDRYNANACYASVTSPTELSRIPENYPVSWLIQAHLTDGTYTYNLYDGDTKVNGDVPISGTSYGLTEPLNEGVHQFTVKTIYPGGESAASNKAGVTMGTASLETLVMDTDETMTITPGSTLTVTGTLENNNPANLVIEDGAQLIHPNSAVQATLKKNIEAYSTDPETNNGWYTITSPVDELGVSIATTGDYDLFTYDEKSLLWLNQKKEVNHITQFNQGQGFLYANAVQKTLAFAGNMEATAEQIALSLSYQSDNPDLKGFNLVGNPFSRNLVPGDITLGDLALTTYYSVEGGSELTSHNINTEPIKPGQGFLVQATTAGQQLVFNPSGSKDKTETQPAYINIEASDDSFSDYAFVQFSTGNTLHKMTLGDDYLQISLQHDKADYAVINFNQEEHELTLNFKAAHNGIHTLSINTVNLDLDYLHLIDNLTGADIDLLATPDYTFEAKANDYAARFQLVFSPKANDDVYGDCFIDGKTTIIDMTGRVVATDRNTSLAPGVYILRTVNGNETNSQKIIIK